MHAVNLRRNHEYQRSSWEDRVGRDAGTQLTGPETQAEMKTIDKKPNVCRGLAASSWSETSRSMYAFKSALAIFVLILWGIGSSAQAAERNSNPGIAPPNAKPY